MIPYCDRSDSKDILDVLAALCKIQPLAWPGPVVLGASRGLFLTKQRRPNVGTGVEYRERDSGAEVRPAMTITERSKTARWRIFMSFGLEIRKHGGAR
jgi:hypothetical protein